MSSKVHEVERRLRDVLHARGDEAALMATNLVADDITPGLDDSLTQFLRRDYLHPRIQQLACRILIERDRDRDPHPILEMMVRDSNPIGKKRGVVAEVVDPPAIVSYEYGFSRLTRLRPLEQYDSLLASNCSTNTRINVAIGLGDSGEDRAVDLLVTCLRDPKPKVRAAASDAIRRLANSGNFDISVDDDAERQPLVDLMKDRDRDVRISALRSLAAVGLMESVLNFSPPTRREHMEMERLRKGDIEPLERTWPGDNTIYSRRPGL